MDDTEGGSKMALCYYGAFFWKGTREKSNEKKKATTRKV